MKDKSENEFTALEPDKDDTFFEDYDDQMKVAEGFFLAFFIAGIILGIWGLFILKTWSWQ